MKQELIKLIIREPGLVKLTLTLQEAGGSLPTRHLLLKMKQWGRGQALIKRAEEQGLIRRKQVPAEGKGNNQTINILTAKGKQLVRVYTII